MLLTLRSVSRSELRHDDGQARSAGREAALSGLLDAVKILGRDPVSACSSPFLGEGWRLASARRGLAGAMTEGDSTRPGSNPPRSLPCCSRTRNNPADRVTERERFGPEVENRTALSDCFASVREAGRRGHESAVVLMQRSGGGVTEPSDKIRPAQGPPRVDEVLTGLRALVLGGTGLIGSHIVRSLVARGCEVRVVSRTGADLPAPALRGLAVEIVRGDIAEPDSIRDALAGVDLLFHAAAPYPTRHFRDGRDNPERRERDRGAPSNLPENVAPELLTYRPRHADQAALEQAEMAAHVARVQPERMDQLRSVVRDPHLLALAAAGKLNASLHPSLGECRSLPGLKRIVYTSSVTTIGRPLGSEPGRPHSLLADESDRYDLAPHPSPYFACKHLMEAAVARAANEGLPVVIVNPTLVVDAGDAHLTTGKTAARGRAEADALLLAGDDRCDRRDRRRRRALLAAIRGRTGHRYILGHERMQLRQFLAIVAEEAGVPPPRVPCPYQLAAAISLVTEWIAYLQGRRWPLFPTHGLRMLRYSSPVDSSLAVNELGLRLTPVRDAVRRALAWYRDEGLLRSGRGRP